MPTWPFSPATSVRPSDPSLCPPLVLPEDDVSEEALAALLDLALRVVATLCLLGSGLGGRLADLHRARLLEGLGQTIQRRGELSRHGLRDLLHEVATVHELCTVFGGDPTVDLRVVPGKGVADLNLRTGRGGLLGGVL